MRRYSVLAKILLPQFSPAIALTMTVITGAIAALPQSAQIDWEYATTIREDYPLVVALATNLGLDTDAIFDLASSFN